MKGKQRMEEPLFPCVQLEDMIPADHIVRKIDKWVDFTFIEEKTRGLYSDRGRPSIDPEVLIRMLVVGYLNGTTAERRICRDTHLNLAYRWFCKFTLEDKVPDHSTFSKNRHGRFAENDLFRELFTEVVRQAIRLGLVSGKHLSVDATTIAADASLGSLEPVVVELSPEEYLRRVEEENPVRESSVSQEERKSSGGEEAKKGNGNTGSENPKEKRKKISNETHRSRTDPDARIFRKAFTETKLAYSDNILMDNKSGIILDVEVTEPNLHEEGQCAAEMLERSRFRLGILPETVGGDKAYGTGPAARALVEAGVDPHVSRSEQGPRNTRGIFGKESFTYDAERDEFICPGGARMRRRSEHGHSRQTEYAAQVKDCSACQLKPQCTRARFRSVQRHWDSEYLERAAALRETEGYRISQRCRKRIEHRFGEGKEQMGLRRARRRGHANVREQCLMTAMVQNMKRIVAAMEKRFRGTAKAAAKNTMPAFQAISRYLSYLWRSIMAISCISMLSVSLDVNN